MTRTDISAQLEIDSTSQIKTMLGQLDNHEMQTPSAILQLQAHLINFKKQRIAHLNGLREIILMRNRLSDGFAKSLQKALTYDNYLKVINIAGNNLSEFGIKCLIKLALIENTSIVAFDARCNPGSTEKNER
jgi:Ran GTPase-activating protein (RanGAP) involved in mRNA processing and transport